MSTEFQASCLISMPYGIRRTGTGRAVDFDRIWTDVLSPAVAAAGLIGIRLDEMSGGDTSARAYLERAAATQIAIFDITLADPNVFWQLGARHALHPSQTLLIACGGTNVQFDLADIRVLSYSGNPDAEAKDIPRIQQALSETVESFGSNLATGYPYSEGPLPESQIERWRVYEGVRRAIQTAGYLDDRKTLQKLEGTLTDLSLPRSEFVEDLIIGYRKVAAWEDVVRVAENLPDTATARPAVRMQVALALVRLGRRREAEQLCLALLEEPGKPIEVLGLLGSIYKSDWKEALANGDQNSARTFLRRAIDTYGSAFRLDPRDPYPGVNQVMLLVMLGDATEARSLVPVVRFSALRLISGEVNQNYWYHAMLLELAVVEGNQEQAEAALVGILQHSADTWQLQTTVDNLDSLLKYGAYKKKQTDWIRAMAEALKAQSVWR